MCIHYLHHLDSITLQCATKYKVCQAIAAKLKQQYIFLYLPNINVIYQETSNFHIIHSESNYKLNISFGIYDVEQEQILVRSKNLKL